MALFAAPRGVLFQEVDAAGVVFFGHFFSYFHDAYVAWLGSIGIDLATVIEERVWIAPLVHAEADYARPLRFGDAFLVEVERAELGASSMTVWFRICSPDEARTFATGKTVHAFIDPETRTKLPPPDGLASVLSRRGEAGA